MPQREEGSSKTLQSGKTALKKQLQLQMPVQLRQLFAIICLYCEVTNKLSLLEKYIDAMTEDFVHRGDSLPLARSKCLSDICEHFEAAGSGLNEQGLPSPDFVDDSVEDRAEDFVTLSQHMFNTLSEEQKVIYHSVLTAIIDPLTSAKCFFIDGPGGTGKTYLYKSLIYKLKCDKKKFVATATTGIASLLLPDGRTAHSKFGIPLSLNDNSTSSIKMQSVKASELRDACLIIIDEVSMLSSHALSLIDRLLRDVMHVPDIPFGGKCILIGGDFRQVLPVVPRGTKVDILMATVKRNTLWPAFKCYKLTRNIRAAQDIAGFRDFLMSLGNGTSVNTDGKITIPQHYLVQTMQELDAFVFGGMNSGNIENYAASAILTPRNDDCDILNRHILSKLDGACQEYRSIDKVVAEGEHSQELETTIATEFIHTLTPAGMPPHRLCLKAGAIVILLRNLNPRTGLCNGTRLLITALRSSFFTAKILTGTHTGQAVMIPKLNLSGRKQLCHSEFPGFNSLCVSHLQ